jgi:hypothetical protein
VVDCYPQPNEYEEHDVDVKVSAPAEGEPDSVDAPDWLQKLAPAVRRLHGTAKDGWVDGEYLELPDAPGVVTMKCPECDGGLNLTGASRRISCDYCRHDLYIPDDLWRRLHPIKKAAHWTIEYEGPNALERRQARSPRPFRPRNEEPAIKKVGQEIPHRELKLHLDRLYEERNSLREELRGVMGGGGAFLLSVGFAGVLALAFYLFRRGPDFNQLLLLAAPALCSLLFLVLVLRGTLRKGKLNAVLADLDGKIATIKTQLSARQM